MKKLLSIALCAVIIFTFVSCTKLESTDEEKTVVMQIGGFDVPYEMLRYAVMNAYDDHIASGGKELTAELSATDEGKALNDDIMSNAKESLRTVYAVFALGEKYGISRDSEAISALVDANLEAQRAGYESDKEYKKALEESHMTMAVARVTLEFDAIYTEVYEAMLAAGDIESDPDKLKEIFMSDEFVRVKELLFSTEKHSAEECRALGEKALAEITAGADFDEYVQKNGESLFMFSNDDGYYICRGIWDEALENAVFALGIGELSDVIVTDDGARLFLREEKSEAFIDKNLGDLTDTYTEGVFRRLVEAQLADTEIETNENYNAHTVRSIAEEVK